MTLFLDVLSWILLVAGGLFVVIGNIGLLRLPDFYTRLHAAGITDTLGASCVLLGLAFQAGWSLIAVKLLLAIILILITSPTATHALAKSALHGKLKPWLRDTGGGSSNW